MRLQVNVSDSMCEKIDFYAKQMGVSRSALCSIMIGQGILGYDKSMEMFNDLSKNIASRIEVKE